MEPVGAAGAVEDDILMELVGQDYGMVRFRDDQQLADHGGFDKSTNITFTRAFFVSLGRFFYIQPTAHVTPTGNVL